MLRTASLCVAVFQQSSARLDCGRTCSSCCRRSVIHISRTYIFSFYITVHQRYRSVNFFLKRPSLVFLETYSALKPHTMYNGIGQLTARGSGTNGYYYYYY